jgi:hypothetical protein
MTEPFEPAGARSNRGGLQPEPRGEHPLDFCQGVLDVGLWRRAWHRLTIAEQAS